MRVTTLVKHAKAKEPPTAPTGPEKKLRLIHKRLKSNEEEATVVKTATPATLIHQALRKLSKCSKTWTT